MSPRPPLTPLAPITLALALLIHPPAAQAVLLPGANGRSVDFAGVKSASPEGLVVRQSPNSPIVTIPWKQLDLEKLRTDQPVVFEAAARALKGETVPLDLGIFAIAPPPEAAAEPMAVDPAELAASVKVGAVQATASGFQAVAVQTAQGRLTARLYIQEDPAETFATLVIFAPEPGDSRALVETELWRALADSHGFALVGLGVPATLAEHPALANAALAAALAAFSEAGHLTAQAAAQPVALGHSAGASLAWQIACSPASSLSAAIIAYAPAPPAATPAPPQAAHSIPLLLIGQSSPPEPDLAALAATWASPSSTWALLALDDAPAGFSPALLELAAAFAASALEPEGGAPWHSPLATPAPAAGPPTAAGQTWLPDAAFARLWHQAQLP